MARLEQVKKCVACACMVDLPVGSIAPDCPKQSQASEHCVDDDAQLISLLKQVRCC